VRHLRVFQLRDNYGEQLLGRLNDAQKHRGPDDAGIWLSRNQDVGFAHRRLSIVELSPLGRQPMCSVSGRYVIVYNGEIYNFLELRSELTGIGHRFKGGSDTEVMLAGFEEWGIPATVRKLNGMFAAAVFDQKDWRLHLFRDRLGVKPLFYLWHGGAFYFSSELTEPFSKIVPDP
jgi:asparagine synthase (glutamine-hydrolysing)